MKLNLRSFTKNSLNAFAIKIASAGLAFLMFASLSRAMDPEAYGLFGTLFSLATLCGAIGSFGQRSNVMKFAAEYDERGEFSLRRGVIQFGYILTFVGALIAGLGGGLFSIVFLSAEVQSGLVSGLVCLTVALALSEYQSRALRVNATVSLSLVPRDIFWRLIVTLSAAASAFTFGRAGETSSFWIWFLCSTLISICLIQWIAHERTSPEQSFRGEVQTEKALWLGQVKGPWASLIVTSLGANLSVILVGLLVNIEQAGPFFSALRIAQLMMMLMLAIEVVLIPMIARNAATENWGVVQKLCSWTSLAGSFFSLLGATVVFFFGPTLLSLFGPEFVIAYHPLLILTVGYLVPTLAGPAAPLLMMTGHAGQLAKYQSIGTFAGLLIMPVGIFVFGMNGAAACIALMAVFWNIMAWRFSRRVIGVDPTLFSFVSTPRNFK